MAWDVNKAVEHLQKNAGAKSQGKCAAFVRQAIEAGGATFQRTTYAKDFGPSLLQAGFRQISETGYKAQKGDVIVIQPYTGSTAGHVEMFDGAIWISDFKQSDEWAGPSYRKQKPARAIYRHSTNSWASQFMCLIPGAG